MGRVEVPIFFILLLVAGAVSARTPADLVSDGVHKQNQDVGRSYLRLLPFSSSDSTCDETYGFMPCTTTWIGNLFLILVYGFLMYTAATYLSGGSELLLEILGPGIVGGLFLPVLGALPDALLILVSGLSGTTSTAQSQVSVGMGLLAGSTVMLLTAIWGSCVIVGKCDFENSLAVDGKDTKGFNLTGSGVTTDIWTTYAAMIMAISVIPFLVVQIPQSFLSSSGQRIAVLIGLILSVALLLVYCLYQVFQPWIQKRRLEYVKHKKFAAGFIVRLKKKGLGRLTTGDGKLDHSVVDKLFSAIDVDKDEFLIQSELRAFVIGTQLDDMKLNDEDLVEKVMKDFDVEQTDGRISRKEFKNGIEKWLEDLKDGRPKNNTDSPDTMEFLTDVHEESLRQHALLGGQEDAGDDEEGENGVIENTKKTTIKALLMLLLGTIIAAMFADPLVDAVDNFSDATGIPSFFISFIFLPLATNSSEAVSAIIFSSRKKRKTASLTFSEIYGAVTMNNVLCLAVFLALVYVRELTWDFSAEVLVIVIVCIVMSVLGSFRTSFPLWTFIIAFAFYPFSLVLVYVLDYVCGWA